MTEEQKKLCKDFLDKGDTWHSCNEYKILKKLLDGKKMSLTEEEKIICNLYLDDIDDGKNLEEYKFLKDLLNKKPANITLNFNL